MSAQIREFMDRDDTMMNSASGRTTRRAIGDGDRHKHTDCGAERGDVERVPEWAPQLPHEAPFGRNHADRKIHGLRRRIQHKRPDCLLRDELPARDENRSAREPRGRDCQLRDRGAAAPDLGICGDRNRHYFTHWRR